MATVKPRGGSYVLQWSEPDADGKQRQHRISLGAITPEQAERARSIKELELAAGVKLQHGDRGAASKALAVRFGEFYRQRYEPWYRAQFPATLEKLHNVARVALLPEFEHTPLEEITTNVVESWKVRRMAATVGRDERWTGKQRAGARIMEPGAKRPISMGTVKRDLSTLMAILRRAVRWGVISKLPCADVEPVPRGDDEVPRSLNAEELGKIYAQDPAAAPAWRLIVNTGMRRSEAKKARWSHVAIGDDGVPATIAIESSGKKGGRTKSGKLRIVPLNMAAIEAIGQLGDDYLLPANLRSTALSRRFERTAKRAGVDASLHDLRHTFCTHLAQAGVPVRVIKEIAGHSTIAVTEKYLWMVEGAAARAVASISL